MTTPNTPPENGANAPPQTGGRISNYVRRHTRGVIVSVIMGLGVLAIAGGGLGGYATWVKSKSPEAGAAVASTTGAAEVAARLLVGGPGSGPAPESSGPAGRISITSSTSTTKAITVNWEEPAGSNITAYHVEWKLQSEPDSAYRKSASLPSTARDHTITGLTSGTGYRIFIGYVADNVYWRTGVWHDTATGKPAVRFMESAYSGTEGGRVTVTLRTDELPDKSFTVPVAVTGGTADADADVNDKAWDVTFPAEVGMVSFYVDVTADAVQEPAETIILGINSGDGYSIGTPGEATVTIAADPVVSGEIQFNPTMYTVTEGVDSNVVITVVRTDDSDHAINFVITANDAMTDEYGNGLNAEGRPNIRESSRAKDGTDYRGGTYTGTIAADQTSTTVSMSILGDEIAEPPQSFPVALSLPSGSHDRLANEDQLVLVSIVDNDVVTMTLKEQLDLVKVGEGTSFNAQSATITPQFDRAFSNQIEVTCKGDHLAFSPAVLKVLPKQWNNPPSMVVRGAKDSDFEYEKTSIDCEMSHAEVLAKDQLAEAFPLPAFVIDDGIAHLPTQDANGDRQRSFMLVGDMSQAGLEQYPAIVIDRDSSLDGPHTFTLSAFAVTGAKGQYCEQMAETAPTSVTVPNGAQNYQFGAKIPTDGHGAICGFHVTPPDGSWTEKGLNASGRHIYAVPWPYQR